jgi:hypothetical protein
LGAKQKRSKEGAAERRDYKEPEVETASGLVPLLARELTIKPAIVGFGVRVTLALVDFLLQGTQRETLWGIGHHVATNDQRTSTQ